MPDGAALPGWPLLMDAATAARFVCMTPRDFRAAVTAGLLPAGRTAADLAGAGLIPADRAACLAGLGAIWHRGEIEARAAHLFGLEGRATVTLTQARHTAREALDAYDPARPRKAALRHRHPPG